MVFITGASSGIGAATARAFAAEGKDLLLVARRVERLKELADELGKKYGKKVLTYPLDVQNRKSVEEFGKQQAAALSKVEIVVNNAGLAKSLANFQDLKPEEWDVMIDTNIKGLLNSTKLVLPYFLEKKSGHIINMGSVAGHHVYPKGNIYCATKFAVHALSEAFRIDMNGMGIRVTEISPGMVETEFSEVRLGDKTKAKAVYAGMTPLTAADVAETIVWCANRPAHVNIQEIVLYPTDQASPSVIARRT